MKIVTTCTLEQFETIKDFFSLDTKLRFKNKTVYGSKHVYGYFAITDEEPDVLLNTINLTSGFVCVDLDTFIRGLKEAAKYEESAGDFIHAKETTVQNRENDISFDILRFSVKNYAVAVSYPSYQASLLPKFIPANETELVAYIKEAESHKDVTVNVQRHYSRSYNAGSDSVKELFSRFSNLTIRHFTDSVIREFDVSVGGFSHTMRLAIPNGMAILDPDNKLIKETIERHIKEAAELHNIDLNNPESVQGFLYNSNYL